MSLSTMRNIMQTNHNSVVVGNTCLQPLRLVARILDLDPVWESWQLCTDAWQLSVYARFNNYLYNAKFT